MGIFFLYPFKGPLETLAHLLFEKALFGVLIVCGEFWEVIGIKTELKVAPAGNVTL